MGRKAQRRHEREMMKMNKETLDIQREEAAIQRGILEQQKEQYRQFQFQNPYANMENCRPKSC